jgi:hypothetical protein
MAKCMYCGYGENAGSYCSKSPSSKCVVINEGHCSYCGIAQTSGGGSCIKSPTDRHVVPKAGKCSYCGQAGLGSSCVKSPTGKCCANQY